MAIALDPKTMVILNELLMPQVVSQGAVIWLYVEKGVFSKEEIIKQGYGFAYIKYPFKYLEEFRRYQKEAKENKMGLWK